MSVARVAQAFRAANRPPVCLASNDAIQRVLRVDPVSARRRE